MAHVRSARGHPGTWTVIAVLLLAALIGTLWVPFYNHTKPALWGFPFFYWYQLMWVPIVAILAAIAYLLSRTTRHGDASAILESQDTGAGGGDGR